MVELREITKFFSANGVRALDRANFDLRPGEIHALLGENGAGKSTLMHVMAGFLKPGTGAVFVDGRERRFSSPAQALSAGIGMVRQHPRLIPGFLVWENCTVGSLEHPPPLVNRRLDRKKAVDLDSRFGFGLPLDSPVENLTVGQEQKAAILALLMRDVRCLVFDEPTAVLGPAETDQLFTLLRRLRDEGRGIVLISHKLDETLELADRVTVLRRGKTRVCCKAGELDNEHLWEHIFDIDLPETGPGSGIQYAGPAEDVLVLKDFSVQVPGRPLVRGVNLNLKRGGIMGIAGVQDSGLETLELALTGFLPASGSFRLNGTELAGLSALKRVRAFRTAGGAYLGTRNEGAGLSIRDILLIHAHRRFQRRGILKQKRIKRWIGSILAAANVPPWAEAAGTALSGGQLQRLLLTRELTEQSSLLVLSNPGRGLDRYYRKTFASLLQEKAAEGTAVLIFSTDVEELFALAGSVTVLRNGVFSASAVLTGGSVPADLQNRIREAMV